MTKLSYWFFFFIINILIINYYNEVNEQVKPKGKKKFSLYVKCFIYF